MAQARFPKPIAFDSVPDGVRAVVARMSGRRSIADRLDLFRDLGFDDADRTELAVAVELAFRIDLPPAEVEGMATIGDLIAAVDRQLRLRGLSAGAGEALREAIKDLAAGAAATGRPIDPVAAANVLLHDHAGAGQGLADIASEIERAAAAAGAAILSRGERDSA